MNRELHICTANDCPFRSCEHHVSQLSKAHTTADFGPGYSVCRKYINWAMEDAEKAEEENEQPQQT